MLWSPFTRSVLFTGIQGQTRADWGEARGSTKRARGVATATRTADRGDGDSQSDDTAGPREGRGTERGSQAWSEGTGESCLLRQWFWLFNISCHCGLLIDTSTTNSLYSKILMIFLWYVIFLIILLGRPENIKYSQIIFLFQNWFLHTWFFVWFCNTILGYPPCRLFSCTLHYSDPAICSDDSLFPAVTWLFIIIL